MGRERVDFEASPTELVAQEIKQFVTWFNSQTSIDPVVKASIAHLWFVTIHPFDDGNGRAARTIADMQLACAEKPHNASTVCQLRLEKTYSVLSDFRKDIKRRIGYYPLVGMFLSCLQSALSAIAYTLSWVLRKAHFWEENV